MSAAPSPETNPLLSEDPHVWDRLIESIGPASMIVLISDRMSGALKSRLEPEDVWQEALLHAWRDRAQCEWRGVKSFRRWIIHVIENRLRNLADQAAALKRGGGETGPGLPLSARASTDGETSVSHFAGPVGSTTPSRIASYHEEARAMQEALTGLDDDVRDIVRLRLFDELSIEEIAAQLGLGESAVKHRFRRGFAAYHQKLRAALATRSRENP
ncbi:MAG: sigma-70 family RNA polymerase sigma factor [Planctomycetota bacterium]